jgi:hypothetical protein
VPEGVTFIGIDDQIDFRKGHGSKIGGEYGEDEEGEDGRTEANRLELSRPHGGCVSVFCVLSVFSTMKPPTDYIRHAARLARKLQMDSAMGGTPQPDAEFFKTLSKAFDEIAAGFELVAKPD